MCNDWVRQVDFDPAQTEFGVGAEGRVTCRQQFLQNSFNVTCRETAPGLFEWELGAHKCVSECGEPALGLAGRRVARGGSSQAAERPWGESCCNEQLPPHGVPGGAGVWV